MNIECSNRNYTSRNIIKDVSTDKNKIYYLNNNEDFHNAMVNAIFTIKHSTYGYNDDTCRGLKLYTSTFYQHVNNYLKSGHKLKYADKTELKEIYYSFKQIAGANYFNKKLCDNKYDYYGKNKNIDLPDLLKYKDGEIIPNSNPISISNLNLNVEAGTGTGTEAEAVVPLPSLAIKNIDDEILSEEYMISYLSRILSNIYYSLHIGLKPIFTCPITLYRGTNYESILNNIYKGKNKRKNSSISVGDIYISDKLISTSYESTITNLFSVDTLLKIHCPSNTKMIVTSQCTAYDGENELILDCFTPFKILSINKKYVVRWFSDIKNKNYTDEKMIKELINPIQYKKIFPKEYKKIHSAKLKSSSDEENPSLSMTEEDIILEKKGLFLITSNYLKMNDVIKESYDKVKSLTKGYFGIIPYYTITMVVIDDNKLLSGYNK